jgi:O-antigen/teichoic acid export membrane protein
MTESPVEKVPDTAEGNQSQSLLSRVLKGSALSLGGHVVSQVIRLGSNLILSRLLFPEAFGLMAIVYTFISGLHMFSDTGTNANIIQSKRGDDRVFLNTAWTVDCIRGVILWICACLISQPVANFYNEPQLAYLLPITALSTLFNGFNSNKLVLANRNLELTRLILIDLIVQVLGIVVIIASALAIRFAGLPRDIAVWALVAGNLAGSISYLILSFTFIKGENDRFQLDRESLHELFQFGRWIFLSTLLTFFAYQGNNLVIPRLLGVGFFGIYSFAFNLSQFSSSIVSMLGGRVLFPSFAELYRDRPERVYSALRRSRVVLNAVNWAVSLIFIIFGQRLISIMYDERYADAGWMLQILALGSLVSMLEGTYSNALLAQGKTYLMTVMMVFQMVFQFGGLFLGYYLGNEFGLVLGVALAGWTLYPIQAIFYAKLSLWQPEVDLPIYAMALIVAGFVLIP